MTAVAGAGATVNFSHVNHRRNTGPREKDRYLLADASSVCVAFPREKKDDPV